MYAPAVLRQENHILLASTLQPLIRRYRVTPLLSMVERLQLIGAELVLHYYTRNQASTAFHQQLVDLQLRHRVQFHHDEGVPGNGQDLAALLTAKTGQLVCTHRNEGSMNVADAGNSLHGG